MPALTPVQKLLQHLLESAILPRDDWDALPTWARERATGAADPKKLVDHLLAQGLLTGYQALRIGAGRLDGLMLGNYRVLDRLGAGNTGVIFRAEHIETRAPAAVKVLVPPRDDDSQALLRFEAERQAVASLRHPNVVAALDLGEVTTSANGSAVLYYYAMEYIEGQDLERLVKEGGPLAEDLALSVIGQVASALAETHRHHLVHRDVNPSNIVLAADGRAKLLDFGLVRHPGYRVSEPGLSVGMLEYAAPEQLRDAGTADIRADVYGLGATLFWCLTGRAPFPRGHDSQQDLARRLCEPAPSARALRPELSDDIEALLQRLMALDPMARFPDPDAVSRAVDAIRKVESPALEERSAAPERPAAEEVPSAARRALVVSPSMQLAKACREALVAESVHCAEAYSSEEALEAAQGCVPEVVLLDAGLENGEAVTLLQALRASPPGPHLKILMLTPSAAPEVVSDLLAAGADGYVATPFDALQLRTRVRTALHLKDAQDRADISQVPPVPAPSPDRPVPMAASRVSGSWLNPISWFFGRRRPASEALEGQ